MSDVAKKLFMPMKVHVWSSAVASDKNPIRVKFVMEDASVGFIPVYDSLEKCREEYPDTKILELETDFHEGENHE